MHAPPHITGISVAPARKMTGATLWIALSVVAIVAFAEIAALLGADANWDLKNYHLYAPYAALADRIDIDHNPAGVAGYLNPTLDLLLTRPLLELGNPRVMSQVLGGLQGLNFVLIMAVALQLLRPLPLRGDGERIMLAVLAALLGMSGAMVTSEIGTTFGDLTTAILVLIALLCCLRGFPTDGKPARVGLFATGGFAVGVATGLKLTNVVFLVALLGAVVLIGRNFRLRASALLGISACGGILLAHGWWSWHLWEAFGNPVFPFFNGIFRSPFYPPTSFADPRFMPWSWKQSLVYPFFFSWNERTAESAFRDFRFPIAYCMAALLGARLLWTAAVERERDTRTAPPDLAMFETFVVLAYIVWQVKFSIQRYAVALELLLPTFVLLALLQLSPRHGQKVYVAIALLLACTTIPGNWGRLDATRSLQPIMAEDVRQEVAPTLNGAAVVLGPSPLAYLAPVLDGRDVAWLGDVFTVDDAQRAKRKLAGRRRVFAITRGTPADIDGANRRLERLGLPTIDGSGCRELATTFDPRLLLCPVAPDLRQLPERAGGHG